MITAEPVMRSSLTALHISLGNAQYHVQWPHKARALHNLLRVMLCIF